MERKLIKGLIKFIEKYILLDFEEETVLSKLQIDFGEGISDFSDVFYCEIQKEEYQCIRENFEKFGPVFYRRIKSLQKKNLEENVDFSIVFSSFGFAQLFENNESARDLSLVFFFILNSLSTNIDPRECNRVIELLSKRGKLHLIYKYGMESLDFLYAHDSEYFYKNLQEHIRFCKDRFPERIQIFEGTEYLEYLQEEVMFE